MRHGRHTRLKAQSARQNTRHEAQRYIGVFDFVTLAANFNPGKLNLIAGSLKRSHEGTERICGVGFLVQNIRQGTTGFCENSLQPLPQFFAGAVCHIGHKHHAHDRLADHAQKNVCSARHGDIEHIVRFLDGAKGNDGAGITGKNECIASEVMRQGGETGAKPDPDRQSGKKQPRVLREHSHQGDGGNHTNDCADKTPAALGNTFSAGVLGDNPDRHGGPLRLT